MNEKYKIIIYNWNKRRVMNSSWNTSIPMCLNPIKDTEAHEIVHKYVLYSITPQCKVSDHTLNMNRITTINKNNTFWDKHVSVWMWCKLDVEVRKSHVESGVVIKANTLVTHWLLTISLANSMDAMGLSDRVYIYMYISCGLYTVALKWNATDKIWDFSTTDVAIWMKQSVVQSTLWGGS